MRRELLKLIVKSGSTDIATNKLKKEVLNTTVFASEKNNNCLDVELFQLLIKLKNINQINYQEYLISAKNFTQVNGNKGMYSSKIYSFFKLMKKRAQTRKLMAYFFSTAFTDKGYRKLTNFLLKNLYLINDTKIKDELIKISYHKNSLFSMRSIFHQLLEKLFFYEQNVQS